MKKKPETSVLSLRMLKADRQRLVEEAQRSGVSISEYVFALLCRGIEVSKKVDFKKTAAVKAGSGEIAEQSPAAPVITPHKKLVDQAFLDDIRKRYPTLNFERLMQKLDEALKRIGKPKTRVTIERLFEIAAGQAGKR
jgi:hypothetical protein